MKHILLLLLLSSVCMGLWLGMMKYHNQCPHCPNGYWELSILLIPILFYTWLMWINGNEKFLKRLITYLSISILYTGILVIAIASTSSFIDKLPDFSAPVDALIGFSSFIFVFAIITMVLNFLLAIYEKRVLSKTNLGVLFFSILTIPVICELWYVILPTPYNGEGHLLPCSHNGSFIFALFLYEGIYYLWLKGKIQINNPLRYLIQQTNVLSKEN